MPNLNQGPGSGHESASYARLSAVLRDFTAAWDRDESPAVEPFLDRLEPNDAQAAVELIYREFCLHEAAGSKPETARYLDRFPRHAAALDRLFQVHDVCSPSLLGRWISTEPALDLLPSAGDEIGPYVLRRELGRGAFARVFLAEQSDLENRLVVLKVSTRMTREPWLLARVRHAHIVEIVSHNLVDEGALQLICMPFLGGATLSAVLAHCHTIARRPTTGADLLAALDAVAAPEFLDLQAGRSARELLTRLTYSEAIAWIGARLAEALDFAYGRNVIHGDVKPSNILLSADGSPLLLDFNLARDEGPSADSSEPRGGDRGGTLAYMAPSACGRS